MTTNLTNISFTRVRNLKLRNISLKTVWILRNHRQLSSLHVSWIHLTFMISQTPAALKADWRFFLAN